MLLTDILRQLQDAIGLATKATNWRGVVKGVTCDCEPVNAPKADVLATGLALALYDGEPRPGIDGVNYHPNTNDGNKPVAGMA